MCEYILEVSDWVVYVCQVRVRLGLYSEYLAEWNAVFDANQTLVIRLEDYGADRLNVLYQIFKHLRLGR